MAHGGITDDHTLLDRKMFYRNWPLIALISSLFAVSLTVAQEQAVDLESVRDRVSHEYDVWNNVAHEYARCSVVYTMLANAAVAGEWKGTADNLSATADAAFRFALIAAKFGRTDEMADKVIASYLILEFDGMRRLIDNDNRNISILIVEHGERCKWAVENFDAAYDYWGDELMSNK